MHDELFSSMQPLSPKQKKDLPKKFSLLKEIKLCRNPLGEGIFYMFPVNVNFPAGHILHTQYDSYSTQLGLGKCGRVRKPNGVFLGEIILLICWPYARLLVSNKTEHTNQEHHLQRHRCDTQKLLHVVMFCIFPLVFK